MGDCVYGQATGCLGTTVHVDAHMVCPCPPALAHAEAAAAPTVFLTAVACLQLAAHVQPGTRVLVHAATGMAILLLHAAYICAAYVHPFAGPVRRRACIQDISCTSAVKQDCIAHVLH